LGRFRLHGRPWLGLGLIAGFLGEVFGEFVRVYPFIPIDVGGFEG
jgi:hypothetical protein